MQLAARLSGGSNVLLFGDLGTGKTQFTKGIAKGLGIPDLIKSPTFTYVHQHELKNGHHFYHYDLYRLDSGEDFESIGLEETIHDPHAINVIEWADRMGGAHPESYIQIDFHSMGQGHEISIKWEDPEIAPDELVEKFWDDWATPLHVREHCKQVANVAVQVAQACAAANIMIDVNRLYTAGLLHDMARVCDFTELDESHFSEEITEEKWEKWKNLRKRYAGQHHADIAYKDLSDQGFRKTAELIRLHNSLSIIEEPEKLEDRETAILFYADKRVKHHETVDLAERFRDGRVRHGKYDDPKTRSKFEEIEKRTFELEKRLFAPLSISPDQIS